MRSIKRLFAFLFRWPLVWTEDHDGAVRLRRVYLSPFGRFYCVGVSDSYVTLHPDGRTSGCRYVERWKPANKRAEGLFPEAAK